MTLTFFNPVIVCVDSLPAHVPQVLINREPLRHLNFDVELLGNCDVIVNELCHRLGGHFSELCSTTSPATEITTEDVEFPATSASVSDSSAVANPTDSASTLLSSKPATDDGDNDSVPVATISATVSDSNTPTPTTTKNAADDVSGTEVQVDVATGTDTNSVPDGTNVDRGMSGCSMNVDKHEEEFPKTEPVNWASLLPRKHL